MAEAYHLCDVAEEALVRGDVGAALAGAEAGLALLPGEGNLLLSYIAALIGVGRIDEAAAEVQTTGGLPAVVGGRSSAPSPTAAWSRCPKASPSTSCSPARLG